MKKILIILLLLASTMQAQGSSSLLLELSKKASADYSSNGDTILVGSSYSPQSGTLNITGDAGGRDFLIYGHQFRIRQTGYITKFSIYIGVVYNSGFFIKIWRKDGTTYDLVSVSENISDRFTDNAVNVITLNTPIYAEEGDFVGFRMSGYVSMNAPYGFTGCKLYYVNGDVTTATDYAWESQSNLNQRVVKFLAYMESPSFVFIGNSIMAGHPTHYSFLEPSDITNLASSIEYQTLNGTAYNYQNMGIGSQQTVHILSRFKTDVIDLHPKYVILEGGVNDVSVGISTDSIITNYTAMFDSLQNNNINASALLIFGWEAGTAAQNRQIDSINAQIKTLTNSYPNIDYIDARSAVNEFRTGGDAGNLWDAIDIYNADHIHYNSAGHGKIAEVIKAKLKIK